MKPSELVRPSRGPFPTLANVIADAAAAAPRQTPLTALRVTSLMNEAGVPKGVFNLVHSPPLLDALSLGGND